MRRLTIRLDMRDDDTTDVEVTCRTATPGDYVSHCLRVHPLRFTTTSWRGKGAVALQDALNGVVETLGKYMDAAETGLFTADVLAGAGGGPATVQPIDKETETLLTELGWRLQMRNRPDPRVAPEQP